MLGNNLEDLQAMLNIINEPGEQLDLSINT